METISSRLQAGLQFIVSTNQWGVHAIRIAIFIIFIWIGGLKFWNYEAEGIVPFVANSPFMNFFYEKKAPEYKDYKLKEGEFDAKKKAWHTENNTYTFSHGLGLLIMSFGILTLLGIWFPRVGFIGATFVILMTIGTVPDVGSGEHGFPLLSGAGRLVIKDTAILAGAWIVLVDCARRVLKQLQKA